MGDELRWADVPADRLNIAATLDSGQCFRWICTGDGDWIGVIGDCGMKLRAGADGFWWQTYPHRDRWDLIQQYFALDVDLERLYGEWRRAEPRTEQSIARNAGMRILRQDADEAFFSFLCASCNTVVKIRRSVQALARMYGEAVAEVDGLVLHAFPTAERIANASEPALRAALWGYRAPVLIDAARDVSERGDGWLDSLRAVPYREAHAELTSIHGIGAKIADCICLFGLWHDEAVPIDTHVRRIAMRLFRPDLAIKSLTPAVYDTLASLFRARFGPYAGWAQQYLFYDSLRHAEDR